MKERLQKLKELWQKKSNAFLIIKYEALKKNHLRYLTNFSGSTGIFLQTNKNSYLLVDGRYHEIAEREKFPEIKLIKVRSNFLKEIEKIIKREKIKKIGIEDEIFYYSYKNLKKLFKKNDVKLVVLENIVSEIRVQKDDLEIEKLKKAQQITDQIFKEILDFIQPGKHLEKDVSFKIFELALQKYKAEELSFEPIVAFGKNSALPHYRAGNEKIGNNGPLLIDFGIRYEGYVSDMTRTIWIGKKPPSDFKKIYSLVLEAQKLALEKCAFLEPTPASRIDKAARDFIAKHGFKKFFLHSTGHGIGMDIHESPTLSSYSQEILKGKEVVTIEPGIYLEKKWGVRIEDTVITGSGEILTHSPKELIVL